MFILVVVEKSPDDVGGKVDVWNSNVVKVIGGVLIILFKSYWQIAAKVYSQCSSFKQFPSQLRLLMHLSAIYPGFPLALFGPPLHFKMNFKYFLV